MNEQISTIQTSEVIELMRNLAPILNQKELFEFMLFSNRVVERYMPEHYNDGMSEEVAEMRKDKAWLIQKVSDIFCRVEIDGDFNIQNANIMFDDISNLIDELDEPEVEEKFYTFDNAKKWLEDNGFVVFEKDKLDEEVQRMIDKTYKEMNEKPVIPQFIADWIESYRKKTLVELINDAVYSSDEDSKCFRRWFHEEMGFESNYSEFLSRSWLDGYEVEKEKLYHVVNKENYFMLRKYDGLVELHTSPSMSRDKHGKDTRFMLTEQEIKDYDKRFWAFAEEVTE